jgi:hypothetical protein
LQVLLLPIVCQRMPGHPGTNICLCIGHLPEASRKEKMNKFSMTDFKMLFEIAHYYCFDFEKTNAQHISQQLSSLNDIRVQSLTAEKS